MICRCKKITVIKLEADIGADPLWCFHCGINLDLEDFPISDRLKKELMAWTLGYGEWIDWDNDRLLQGAVEKEKQFNLLGEEFLYKLKTELSLNMEIAYSRANTVDLYQN
ncbi:hypothetical protein F9U64_07810 [Gracilibacillus oryzae]|uniref:Uncharacterized protein n=1 Tax=Gracilibacillus oryzae TaxID=1672701 RepID=A0A7C8GU09_9BACI|nr:hypothetical protein [Gracilibacillus oryzae]KAB8137831.1 hypothetical protein F9U64_07810 [Gracilibacillus oryzae]